MWTEGTNPQDKTRAGQLLLISILSNSCLVSPSPLEDELVVCPCPDLCGRSSRHSWIRSTPLWLTDVVLVRDMSEPQRVSKQQQFKCVRVLCFAEQTHSLTYDCGTLSNSISPTPYPTASFSVAVLYRGEYITTDLQLNQLAGVPEVLRQISTWKIVQCVSVAVTDRQRCTIIASDQTLIFVFTQNYQTFIKQPMISYLFNLTTALLLN